MNAGVGELLKRAESKTLDFKRDLSGSKGIRKDLVAFANTSGGTLVIGVEDDKTVRGLADPLKDEEKLANFISDAIRPALLPDIELTTYEGKDLLIVRVARAVGPFYLKEEGPENGVYIRVGSTNRRADTAALAELRRSLLNVSFDQEPSLVDRSGLDDNRIESALAAHGMASDSKLEGLGVITGHQGKRLASHGGVILFGRDDERQRHFPDAYVRCAYFAGEKKSADMLDQLDLYDHTIIEAVDAVEQFIRRNTRTAGRVKGMRRTNIPEYSEVMLREILINALAHSDYSLLGMQVKVALYANRLEIENPGFLPFGMTIEHLKAGQSKTRNRVIARVFDAMNLLEGWGRAWQRIEEAMTEGYPEPDLVEQGAAFRVTLWPHPAIAEIAAGGTNGGRTGGKPTRVGTQEERRSRILAEIDATGGVKSKDVVERLSLPQRTAERDLAALVASGEIEFVGARKTGSYRRKTSPDR